MKTYRDILEMILNIYWEQLEKAVSATIYDMNLTASHMCAVSYDLIGVIY